MKPTTKPVYEGAFEPFLDPKLFRVGENLVLAQFEVMKTLPAYNIISQALASGEIQPGNNVIDTSSGNFALGLALVCKHFSLPLCVVSDPAIDERLKTRLNDLGTQVDIVSEPDKGGSYQRPRLERLKLHMEREPFFWAQQYYNVNNPKSYQPFADVLLSKLGSELVLVGAVGSGGSTSGTITYLREKNPSIRLVAVDTFNSVLFGLPDGKRALRGLGNSLQPGNLNHSLYDEVHWISANVAHAATRTLHKRFGSFSGPTTGAAYLVGRHLAKNCKDKTVVVIGPDDGARYVDSVYNNQWLSNNSISSDPLLLEPQVVSSPTYVEESGCGWQSFQWGRRPLASSEIKE